MLACGVPGCVGYLLVKWLTYLHLSRAGARLPVRRLIPYHRRSPRADEAPATSSRSSSRRRSSCIARALRAGHAFPTGLQMVADEMPEPVGAEFKLLYDRQNFGMPLPDALKGFAERIPLLDARFFVTAVLTQRETGGNLSEVLDNLASSSASASRSSARSASSRRTDGSRAGFWRPAAGAGRRALLSSSPDHMKMLITRSARDQDDRRSPARCRSSAR